MPEIIAVDLGGTNIRVARFPTVQIHPSAQSKTPTQAADGPGPVIARILRTIEEIASPLPTGLRIGVAAPGPLDPRQGIVIEAANLPGWHNIPLRAQVAEHFHCPVAVGNDANLAAVGEWRFGAGRGTHDLLYLTISTGIGGGVIIDDALLVGSRGLGAELGHMTIDRGGPLCGCGRRGHLEAIASGPAIARAAAARLERGEPSSLADVLRHAGPLSAEQVGRAANEGDPLAMEVVAAAAEAIGCHLASLMHAFDPQVIVLGGGVMQIGDFFMQRIDRAMRQSVMSPAYLDGLRLLPAQLGDDAGLIGAMVAASEL